MEHSRLYISPSERLTPAMIKSNFLFIYFFCQNSLVLRSLGFWLAEATHEPLTALISYFAFLLDACLHHGAVRAPARLSTSRPTSTPAGCPAEMGSEWSLARNRCFPTERPAWLQTGPLVAALVHWGSSISTEKVHPAPVGIPTTVSQSPSGSVQLPLRHCL